MLWRKVETDVNRGGVVFLSLLQRRPRGVPCTEYVEVTRVSPVYEFCSNSADHYFRAGGCTPYKRRKCFEDDSSSDDEKELEDREDAEPQFDAFVEQEPEPESEPEPVEETFESSKPEWLDWKYHDEASPEYMRFFDIPYSLDTVPPVNDRRIMALQMRMFGHSGYVPFGEPVPDEFAAPGLHELPSNFTWLFQTRAANTNLHTSVSAPCGSACTPHSWYVHPVVSASCDLRNCVRWQTPVCNSSEGDAFCAVTYTDNDLGGDGLLTRKMPYTCYVFDDNDSAFIINVADPRRRGAAFAMEALTVAMTTEAGETQTWTGAALCPMHVVLHEVPAAETEEYHCFVITAEDVAGVCRSTVPWNAPVEEILAHNTTFPAHAVFRFTIGEVGRHLSGYCSVVKVEPMVIAGKSSEDSKRWWHYRHNLAM